MKKNTIIIRRSLIVGLVIIFFITLASLYYLFFLSKTSIYIYYKPVVADLYKKLDTPPHTKITHVTEGASIGFRNYLAYIKTSVLVSDISKEDVISYYKLHMNKSFNYRYKSSAEAMFKRDMGIWIGHQYPLSCVSITVDFLNLSSRPEIDAAQWNDLRSKYKTVYTLTINSNNCGGPG